MSDLSLESDNVSLSDSIFSNSSVEGVATKRGEVIDMSRWRDQTMTKVVVWKGKGWSTPMNGDLVSIHYTAKREDGSVFDSSRKRNQVFTFTVGRKQVIKGLDVAIKTMKWSEVSNFTFSGEYSFDETNCPEGMAPGARVSYEVELFYFKLIDLTKKKDGGLTKRIITPGNGHELAIFGSKCDVHFVGKYEDKVFEERSVSFTVGEAEVKEVIEGIEKAVTKMRKEEKCLLFVKPEYAFGPKGKPEFGIPDGYREVVYEITLKDFTEAKEPFQLLDRQKLATAEVLKTKANDYFNQCKYSLAVKQYKRMVKVLRHDSKYERFRFDAPSEMRPEEYGPERDRLLYIAYQNLSNCYQKMNQLDDCLQCVQLALKLEPQNPKGLYRRGRAYYDLHEYKLARDDFQKSLEFGPNNKSAQNYIALCNNAIKTNATKDRQMFSKLLEMTSRNRQMFSKLFTDSKPKSSFDLKEFGDALDIEEYGSEVKDTTASTSKASSN
ncbi:unnamed protein product [Medioppia subpectinata]|uniref:peptidylprolyl isomerase n=1 Tax=Medioppia subpectinata TaxID=1979941 RepID=A0A7R9KQE1_9ACAR|nr:unnamed protein product [Medioppia subpectinata]CAG2107896.1 unnamed protein product [Medioppia subpectinata]